MIVNIDQTLPRGLVLPDCRSGEGWFYLGYWHRCRDTFAFEWENYLRQHKCLDAAFFYCFPKDVDAQQIFDFIVRIEELLKLAETSVFARTNVRNILWVKPSPFWQTCIIRRSFFTALLRCVWRRSYRDRRYVDFESALYSIPYLQETRNAVVRFLSGFTIFNRDEAYDITGEYPDSNMGWWTFFNCRTDNEICRMLM